MSTPAWSKAGEAPQYPDPHLPPFATGDDAMGTTSVVASDNAALALSMSTAEPRKTAFHRGAMGAAEATGANLTRPSTSLAPDPLAANSLRSRSDGSRSTGTFRNGMSD